MNPSSASGGRKSQPCSISRAFSWLYSALFSAWAIFMLIPINGRLTINLGDWSNTLAPLILFLALVVSARRAGLSLDRDSVSANRIRPIAVFRSALLVASTLAGTLFFILALGFAFRRLPGVVVFIAPSLVFIQTLLFTFFAHWGLAVWVFKRSTRHA